MYQFPDIGETTPNKYINKYKNINKNSEATDSEATAPPQGRASGRSPEGNGGSPARPLLAAAAGSLLSRAVFARRHRRSAVLCGPREIAGVAGLRPRRGPWRDSTTARGRGRTRARSRRGRIRVRVPIP